MIWWTKKPKDQEAESAQAEHDKIYERIRAGEIVFEKERLAAERRLANIRRRLRDLERARQNG